MATVYKIEIKAVSDWVNHPPEFIEKTIRNILETRFTSIDFKKAEIKVERLS